MSSLASSSAPPSRPPRAARLVLSLLEKLPRGSLALTLPDGETSRFGPGGRPAAALRVHDWGVFSRALASGDVGFARDWMDGHWDTDALPALLDLLVTNRDALERAVYGSAAGRLIHTVRHWLRRNSKAGSRRNIAAHYDLGNDFYRLWLDPTWSYSSAWWPEGRQDLGLEDAQRAKLDRVLERLDLPAGGRVLEIGCGWGGLAEAATRRGLHLTGLTLSVEQLAFARDRLRDAGLSDRAELRLQDYRDTRGQWDGVASIEMFEAVGERWWPAWFDCVHRNLVPGGRAVVQTITIDERLFERYRTGTDFIQQHVFPGGMLPTKSVFERLARRHGFAVIDRLDFGRDYARTLALWREAFMAKLDAVRAQGFDARFVRLWEFYLAYCEAAFAHGNTDVVQYTLLKAD